MNLIRPLLVSVLALGASSSICACEDGASEPQEQAPLADAMASDTAEGTDLASTPDNGTDGVDSGLADARSPDDAGPNVDCCGSDAETADDTAQPEDGGAEEDTFGPECEGPSQCKDFDNCTEDLCVGGLCQNPAIAGCCTADDACDDGIECTVDKCNFATLKCSNTPEDNLCCLDHTDCNDFNDCTLDACVANQCIHPTNVSGAECTCVLDILCDDSNPCTVDKCVSGSCTYDAAPSGSECCSADSDCADADETTVDKCVAGLCWNGQADCTTASDCPSVSLCLEASCDEGTCKWSDTPGCCVTNADCDDGEELTTDRCIQGTCVFTLGTPLSCSGDADCGSTNACVTGACVTEVGFCSLSPTGAAGCCANSTDCPAVAAGCGSPACEAFSCQVADSVALVPYWKDDFGAATLQWTVVEDASAAKWQLASAQYISPAQSLYFGALPAMTIDIDSITQGTVTSPVITPDLSQPVMLSFQRNAAVEAITSVDKFWLEVVDEATGTGVEVWNKNYNFGPGLGWKSVVLNISSHVSGPFRLRFEFDSIDALSGPLNEGVYVDDVRVGTPCQ